MRAQAGQGELFGETTRLPDGLVYERDFISPAQEQDLLNEIGKLPLREADYKGYTAKRRIASFGSAYDFTSKALDPGPPLPDFLLPLRERIAAWLDLAATRFPHALVTEYRPGTALGWHRDVPQFEVIVGISLHSACRMRFRRYPPEKHSRKKPLELRLQPRSIYVMRGTVRWRWQHSIPMTAGLRYSITFRTLADEFQAVKRSKAGTSAF
jgi:alkylated DNA repair dioxygenase AlkB